MAKINDYFLKAIFKEHDVTIEDDSITSAVRAMTQFVIPKLYQSDNGNYDLYYFVPFEKIKETDIDESSAFELRQYGWVLSDSEKEIIKKI